MSTAAAAHVPSTSTAAVSSKNAKKRASTLAGDQDIVQLLMQHQEKSGGCWQASSACYLGYYVNQQQVSMCNISV